MPITLRDLKENSVNRKGNPSYVGRPIANLNDAPLPRQQTQYYQRKENNPYPSQQYHPKSSIQSSSEIHGVQKKEPEEIDEKRYKVKGNHPNRLSKEAMKILNGDKNIILGSKFCGHCSHQDDVNKGKFYATKIVSNGKNYKIETEQKFYKDSINININTLKQLDSMYKERRMDKNKYLKERQAIEHLINVNQVLIDPEISKSYDKIRENYMILYADDVSPKEAKQLGKIMKNAKKKQIPLDQIYESLKKQPNSDRLVKFLVAYEIENAYGVQARPTFINKQCEIPKNISKRDQTTYLSRCITTGGKDPIDLIQYDAIQRNDTELLQKLSRVVKEKRNDRERPNVDALINDKKLSQVNI